MDSGWADAQAMLKRYGTLIACILGSAVVLPTAVSQVGFAPPPWPKAAVLIAGIVQVVFALLALQTTEARFRRTAKRKMTISALILLCSIFAYSLAFSQLVFLGGPEKELLVKGFSCTTDALRLYAKFCPFLNEPILSTGESVEQFWTPTSISTARVVLLSTWTAMFAALAFTLTVFISFQSMNKARFIDLDGNDAKQANGNTGSKQL